MRKQKTLEELVKTWCKAELKSAINYQGTLLSGFITDPKSLEKANSDYRIFKKEYNKRG